MRCVATQICLFSITTMTENCENCKLSLLLEEKRIKWCNELGLKNVQLLEQLHKQQQNINNLQQRLIERNKIIHINTSSVIVDYLKEILAKNDGYDAGEIKELLRELEWRLENFIAEEVEFERILNEKNEEYYSVIAVFREMVKFYRTTQFDDMKQLHGLKSHLLEQADKLERKTKSIKEEQSRSDQKLCVHYKNLLKQNHDDLKCKEELIDKLRGDRKQLYTKITKIKQELKMKEEGLIGEIERLKMTIKGMRQRQKNSIN